MHAPSGQHRTDDDDLLRRAGAGDDAAWGQLAERHLPRLVATAWYMLGDAAEAEDVAQESFVRLLRKAPDWEPGGAALGTWLHRVAVNLCIDRLRTRRPDGNLDDLPETVLAGPDAGSLDGELDRQRAVRTALDSLPEKQRAAIVLVHYQGFSNHEAGDLLGTSVEAVESLLSRARRSLRGRLEATAADLLENT